MRIVTTLIFLIVVSSCATRQRCLRKFQILPDTISVVSYRDSIVYRDTVIKITIPGETVVDSVIIPCPPPPPAYVPDTARAETSLAIAKAWYSYTAIRLQLIQRDTTIEARLDSALREMYFWKSEYYKVTIPGIPDKPKIPVYYKIAVLMWGFVFLAVLVSFLAFLFHK